jgi:membrane-associated protease RseP (regulator of RpoE activity)
MNRETKRILIQVGLFVLTFITTTFAGAEWAYGTRIYSITEEGEIILNAAYSWSDFQSGFAFSIPLLLILTVHEFGHYFMAMFHKVKTSLPYYIPIPPIPFLPFSIGTMGAVIRLRTKPRSNLENFDIGLAGPLAGFIVALFILAYGFMTLPPQEYIFQFHPEYEQYGEKYADIVYTDEYAKQQQGVIDVQIGTNLIFWLFGEVFADPAKLPNAHEVMHYPVLLACYIALFVTCLNLFPIGQLDGGHVVYGLFGFRIHRAIATVFFIAVIFYSGLGLEYIDPGMVLGTDKPEILTFAVGVAGYFLFLFLAFKALNLNPARRLWLAIGMGSAQIVLMYLLPGISGFQGWLLFIFLIGRLIGVSHPPSEIEQPLDSKRVVLGWITLAVFVLCFSPAPIVISLR